MLLLTVLLTVRLTTSTVGSSCKTAFDCSLNGVCNVATGVCACDAPWKDAASGEEACSVLDVLPHADDYVPAYGGPRTDTAYHANQTMTSWGGNILGPLEDGKFHMWVSAMGGGSGLDGWTHISEIHHATASDPMDAFTRVDTAPASALVESRLGTARVARRVDRAGEGVVRCAQVGRRRFIRSALGLR
jgi:hypothetical protein